MNRSEDMSALDRLESILSKSIYHFDEQPIRQLSEQTGVYGGKNEIVWQRKKTKCQVLTDNMRQLKYIDLEESNPNAHLRHVFIEDVDKDSLIIKPDNFSVKCYKERTYGKGCDYVLFTRFSNKKYAIFIELKTFVSEEQNNGDLFVYNNDFDKGIVWQLIGADALVDGMVDVTYKLSSSCHKSILCYKKGAGKSDLASFSRRYIVLYEDYDRTGNVQMLRYADPNTHTLEKPIHVLQVNDSEHISIGALFSRGGLEL